MNLDKLVNRVLGPLTYWFPKTVLAVIPYLGLIAYYLFSSSRKRRELGLFLEPLVGRDWKKVARNIYESSARNRALRSMISYAGYSSVECLLTQESIARLKEIQEQDTGGVLAAFHSGPLLGIHAGLHIIEASASILTIELHHRGPTPLDIIKIDHQTQNETESESRRNAGALCRDRLVAKGFVFVALPGSGARPTEISLLGHSIRIPGGAVTLAILTDTPVYMLDARWTKNNMIDIQVGPQVYADPDLSFKEQEKQLIESIAEHYNKVLGEDPTQLYHSFLDHYLRKVRSLPTSIK